LKTADQREKEQKDKADAERAARQKSERDSVLRRESALLLQQFDEAMAGEERQQRGYFLQDLLNRAFDLHGIPAARLLADWLVGIGLDPHVYGTHSLRRTKATLIYRRTGNLRAVQLLLGHTKIESTVRYLGIDIDDALAISEQVDI
jgi:integrase